MEDLIKKIKLQKIPVFFVSPHLDDAALSCGELIRKLGTLTSITVINVFTRAGNGRQTVIAKKAVKASKFLSALDLYIERVSEDKKALESINAKVINLNYIDAPWRKIKKPSIIRKTLSILVPEFIHVYPTYRFHISNGKIAKEDNELITKINKNLKEIISKNSIVFCPFGIGNHVDHLLTKKAVEKCFDPIYWMDQPYFQKKKPSKCHCEEHHDSGRRSQVPDGTWRSNLYQQRDCFAPIVARNDKKPEVEFSRFIFKVNVKSKRQLISFYRTQINLLFPGGRIPELSEIFITKDK